MSLLNKYNRVSEFPTYQVEFKKAMDFADDGAHPVTFIGINNNSKYGDGRQPYVDIESDSGDHYRVNVSHSYVDDFEEMIHDEAIMKEIASGAVSVEFIKAYSRKFNKAYVRLNWID